MNQLVEAGGNWQAGVIIVCALVLLAGFVLIRSYYRRSQIKQITKMSKEFRLQQSHWEDRRKGLEEDNDLLRADLRGVQKNLDEVRREHNRQSAEWQENQHQLGQRVKQLYQLVKKREREKIELEKQLALKEADARREKEHLERSNLRLRGELEQRGTLSRPSAEWEQQQRELREQLMVAQAEVLALQRQMADQSQWAEQVQQTLEEELVQVSEQLDRLQQDQDRDGGNVKTLVR